MIRPCFASSVLFIFNAGLCWYYAEYAYAVIFAALTCTSLAFHYDPTNPWASAADKLAVLAVVVYGGYRFGSKHSGQWTPVEMAVLATFGVCLALFFWPGQFCHDPEWGDAWHAILHGVSSAGHALILLI